jgi:putative hydrolase of the HAD superfamily
VIEGAVFDLGSTLIRFTGDWQQVIEDGHQRMLKSLLDSGLEVDSDGFTSAFGAVWQATFEQREVDHIERPIAELLHDVLVESGCRDASREVVERAIESMFSSSEAHWHPMPGVYSVLEELQAAGLRLGIVSNASDAPNVHRLVDNARLRPYFDPIVVSAEERVRKPDRRVFDPVLQAWGLPAERLVMTGDSLAADIAGAQQLGMLSIWLSADADTPENRDLRDKIIPDAVAETLVEVPDIIRGRGIAQR